jgi:hypothetical protein
VAEATVVLLTILFMVLVCAAPLIAATFVARRMGYKGIAVIAPWLSAVGLALLIGGALYGIGKLDPSNPLSMSAAWVGGGLSSGYLTTLVYLIVLAIRRLPLRPADTAAVF